MNRELVLQIKARSTSDAVAFVLKNTGLPESSIEQRNVLCANAIESEDYSAIDFIPGISGMTSDEAKKATLEYRNKLLEDLKIAASYKYIYGKGTVAEAINEIKLLQDASVEELPANYVPEAPNDTENPVYSFMKNTAYYNAKAAFEEANGTGPEIKFQ